MKKKICILGAGQFGRKAAHLLNTNYFMLLAYGDNNPALHGQIVENTPVFSVEKAVSLQPDYLLLGVAGEERALQLREQALQAGFGGEFMQLWEYLQKFDIRSGVLFQIAERIRRQEIPGAAAELGVYRGDFSWKINLLFPDRILYLFDTFEGFDERDLSKEEKMGFAGAAKKEFADTSEKIVLEKLPHPERAVIKKGYFPQSAKDLQSVQYAFVSLDADLYAPIYEGISYFYPRMSQGGVIFLHDYGNQRFPGASRAVEDYEKQNGRLPLVPLCDMHGSAVIVRP